MEKVKLTTALRIASLSVFLILVGCGGSSSSNTANNNNPEPPTMTDNGSDNPPAPVEQSAPAVQSLSPILSELTFDASEIANNAAIQVDVAEGDVSMLVNIRNTGQRRLYVSEVTDPSGRVIYSANVPAATSLEEATSTSDFTNFVVGGERGDFALLLPAVPEADLEVGTYNIRFTGDTSIGRAVVLIKSSPEGGDIDMVDQVVDLNFWVAHTEEQFRNQDFFDLVEAEYRRHIDNLLMPHRMSLGEINFFTATAEQITRFTDIEITEGELTAICQAILADVQNPMAINLGFVDNLAFQNDPFGGVASALPGAVGDPDSEVSCVVASETAFAQGGRLATEEDANIAQASNILHEAGHFMSLAHTTESDGLIFDRFNDTLECDVASFDGRDNVTFDVPGERDGSVSDHECGFAGDADNMMFHGGDRDFQPFEISTDQAWVMRRHPLFKIAP